MKANQPGILLQATLATFDSSDTLQQPTSSPWFEIVAADTWYLVSLPASIFKVPADAAKGHLKFTIDGATVDGSSVINLSETCVFADEAKPALTSNNGTATLANGNTIVTVDHGLGVTPSAGNIMVTPIEEWGNMTQFWVGTCNSNQFDICADQDPGQDVDFAWKATIA